MTYADTFTVPRCLAIGLLFALMLTLPGCEDDSSSPDSTPTGTAPVSTNADQGREAPPPGLSEESRQYLWEVEHRILVLKKYGLKPLATAIANADWESVLQAVSEDCKFQIPAEGDRIEVAEDFGQIVRESWPADRALQTAACVDFGGCMAPAGTRR